MQLPRNAKQVRACFGLVSYYEIFIKNYACVAEPLMNLTHHDAKCNWTLTHQAAFITLKGALLKAPILLYPDSWKHYTIHTDALDDICRAQLSQEHYSQELPFTFLSHTFMDTHYKWSNPKQEGCGVHYTLTKWNYYLWGSDIILHNDHKSLQKFLNGENAINKVNHWPLELATYNITFEWISGACNKAADCLSRLVEVPIHNTAATHILIDSVTALPTEGPATHTWTKTKASVEASLPDTTKVNAPPLLTWDCMDTLFQMQWTDPFCKCISKLLINGKAPQHELDIFTHINSLLCKHALDASQKFLALVSPNHGILQYLSRYTIS